MSNPSSEQYCDCGDNPNGPLRKADDCPNHNKSSNLQSAARELIEAIREFPPVGGCYSAIIKNRLVNALEDALERPSPPHGCCSAPYRGVSQR
jgi:hypothetical protein